MKYILNCITLNTHDWTSILLIIAMVNVIATSSANVQSFSHTPQRIRMEIGIYINQQEVTHNYENFMHITNSLYWPSNDMAIAHDSLVASCVFNVNLDWSWVGHVTQSALKSQQFAEYKNIQTVPTLLGLAHCSLPFLMQYPYSPPRDIFSAHTHARVHTHTHAHTHKLWRSRKKMKIFPLSVCGQFVLYCKGSDLIQAASKVLPWRWLV